MTQDADDLFFDRVDAYIQLANTQLETAELGEVSTAFMYAFSRYIAWVSARDADSAQTMRAKRGETLAFFTKQFQDMLKEGLDDYIEHFDDYREDDA